MDAPRVTLEHKVRTLTILTFLAALWLLLQGYQGLTGDAQLYAFQALSKNLPNLAGDLYLKNTSQDQFTIFSRFYAFFIDLLGLEPAARFLTLAFTAWLLIAAWSLVRSLVSGDHAWLAVAFILIFPSDYGASGVFHFNERFLTARLPAEAMIITALACHFRGMKRAALWAAAAALFVHPLIALPGLLTLICLRLPVATSACAAAAGVFALLGLAVASAYSPALERVFHVMDTPWLDVVRERSQFLFLQLWSVHDWDLNIKPLLGLSFSAIVIEDARIQQFCISTIIVGVAGLAVAVVASLIGPVAILLQGQAWRWVWIPGFTAIVLLPITLLTACRDGKCGLLCATLLLAGCTVLELTDSIVLALAIWTSRSSFSWQVARVLRWVAAAILTAALAWTIVKSCAVLESSSPPADALRRLFALKTPALLLTFIVRQLSYFSRPLWESALACVLLAALIVSVWSAAFKTRWSLYNDRKRDEFAEWINAIPSTSTVLVVPPRDVGQFVWFELSRPNYLTVDQSSGVVFSRATALEVTRRSELLRPLMSPNWKILSGLQASAMRAKQMDSSNHPLTAATLVCVCKDPELGFVISPEQVGFDPLPHRGQDGWNGWNLYDCARVRSHSAVAP